MSITSDSEREREFDERTIVSSVQTMNNTNNINKKKNKYYCRKFENRWYNIISYEYSMDNS